MALPRVTWRDPGGIHSRPDHPVASPITKQRLISHPGEKVAVLHDLAADEEVLVRDNRGADRTPEYHVD